MNAKEEKRAAGREGRVKRREGDAYCGTKDTIGRVHSIVVWRISDDEVPARGKGVYECVEICQIRSEGEPAHEDEAEDEYQEDVHDVKARSFSLPLISLLPCLSVVDINKKPIKSIPAYNSELGLCG